MSKESKISEDPEICMEIKSLHFSFLRMKLTFSSLCNPFQFFFPYPPIDRGQIISIYSDLTPFHGLNLISILVRRLIVEMENS